MSHIERDTNPTEQQLASIQRGAICERCYVPFVEAHGKVVHCPPCYKVAGLSGPNKIPMAWHEVK